jgi:hypothetical protein
MFEDKVYRSNIINKMGHVSERFRLLMRSRSFKKDHIEAIDYHLTEIIKILNQYS